MPWTPILLALLLSPQATPRDLAIYGGTSAGVIAAVQARRMGLDVVLIAPSGRLGGLTASGLGATDIGNKAAIGGLSREFYRRVAEHYARPEAWRWQRREAYRSRRQVPGEETMWTFEPHVAERIFDEWVREAGIAVLRGERLDRAHGVIVEDGRIASIAMEGGRRIAAAMFIDATYEGDLLAAAGVGYTVGREAASHYGEDLNGVQPERRYHQFKVPIDPYLVPGDPSSGLLPEIQAGPPGEPGQGDRRVQAYCFRMCLTDVPGNRRPFPRPVGYRPERYALLLRYLEAGVLEVPWHGVPMPNAKTDTNNNGAFSTDYLGGNSAYPDADYATRERIVREHRDYQQGLLWFLANDPRVPAKVRDEVARWGLSRDEFTATDGWPHQLYIREARRMVGSHVMTQHECQGRRVALDPVGLAAYTMDSHNVQRYAAGGRVWNEGDVQVGGFPPYPIALLAIVPRAEECSNLVVPVCLSASHIAYGSIRMEPVFMVLGQSAATVAALAIQQDVPVQEVDRERLRARLLADAQVLEWRRQRPVQGRDPKTLPGVVLDDRQAIRRGEWLESTSVAGYVGVGYLHDGASGKGARSIGWSFTPPAGGRWPVRMSYTPHPNRSRRVPVILRSVSLGKRCVHVDQRAQPAIAGLFHELGVFELSEREKLEVEILTEGTEGHVVADAIQFLRVEK